MPSPAAIKATYADYRRVKGRKVLQLILEVPLEQAPRVHEAFGEPLPDGSTWVGVARIDPSAKPERKGGPLARRAGILCNEGAFWKFLAEKHDPDGVIDSYEAADWVRQLCGVESRADLDHDPEAADKFRALDSAYTAWRVIA